MGVAERKQREKEMRTESIQRVAKRLFAKKGVGNTTMAQIAEEAELAKGTLYLFFRSKEELLYTLMEPYLQRFLEQVKEVTNRDRERADRTLLRLTQVFVRAYEEDSEPFQVMLEYKAERIVPLFTEERVERLKNLMRQNLEAVAGVIVRGIKQGIFRQVDPRATSTAIWSQLLGICRFEQNRDYEGKKTYLRETLVAGMELILNGVKG